LSSTVSPFFFSWRVIGALQGRPVQFANFGKTPFFFHPFLGDEVFASRHLWCCTVYDHLFFLWFLLLFQRSFLPPSFLVWLIGHPFDRLRIPPTFPFLQLTSMGPLWMVIFFPFFGNFAPPSDLSCFSLQAPFQVNVLHRVLPPPKKTPPPPGPSPTRIFLNQVNPSRFSLPHETFLFFLKGPSTPPPPGTTGPPLSFSEGKPFFFFPPSSPFFGLPPSGGKNVPFSFRAVWFGPPSQIFLFPFPSPRCGVELSPFDPSDPPEFFFVPANHRQDLLFSLLLWILGSRRFRKPTLGPLFRSSFFPQLNRIVPLG